jgi:thioredoxin reductase (NADPH)
LSEELYDITILGAGPAGLFTAFYGGMRQAKVKVIESLPQIGGQLAALYPEKNIYDVAGFPKIKAVDLIENLEKQAMFFGPTIVLDQQIEKVERLEDGNLKLTANNGSVHYTKTMIITAGNGAFTPRRLNIANSEEYEGNNLHYHVTDMEHFRDKNVVLLGGGDSAVDWALILKDIAKQVTLVHRRDQFRAHESSVEALKQSSVEIVTPFAAESITASDKIDSITLKEVRGEEMKTFELDEIICNYGFISSLGPIKDWGLEIEKNSIVVNTKMETNIPGIYAAGDVTTYDGKVKLIVTGFGEGPTAVNNAMRYMNPKARVQPRHSTDMDIF